MITNNESSLRIHKTMRSLYRLHELKAMNSPDILLNKEKELLQHYLLNLSAEEILTIATGFNDYLIEQQKQAVIDNEFLTQDFNNYLRSLN